MNDHELNAIKKFFLPLAQNRESLKLSTDGALINKDIVVSSHRTNKGMELYRQGFKVIYFGSESYSYYIPYDKSIIPIYFAEDILQLKTFLHVILNKKI